MKCFSNIVTPMLALNMAIVLLPTLPDEKNGIFKRSSVDSNNMSILTQAFCILGPFVLASGWHTGIWCQFCNTGWVITVQFCRSVVSDSLWPHGLQHARPPCPSPTPGAYSDSCPSSRWCHPTISSSVVPYSFCLQSFPASGSFPVSQFFTSNGQSIEVSASTSVLPMNFQWIFQWIFRNDFL